MMIDTHAHLYLDDFDSDRESLMERCLNKGVERVYLPNIDSSTTDSMLKMEQVFPDHAFPMMGLHPCSVKENVEHELQEVKRWLDQRNFAAIGETGLDFYWDITFKEEQIEAFSRQIDWAMEYQLPIVIHARNSIRECIDLIGSKQNGTLKGIFHCFSGTLKQADEIIKLGFLMGIGGLITFKNSNLSQVVQKIGLKHLVLETDSPYLTPSPHRGKRNESSYIPYIAEKIASVQGLTTKEVANVTSKNALSLYKL